MDETIQIPGFKIERNLGSGAMATVYLAEQSMLARKVALKLMTASLGNEENFQKRFIREGRAVAQLNHPHIVTIYDIGIHQSSYFMAMEYVDGGSTLKEKIQQGLTPEQAVLVLRQIGSALGYAHKRGLVHRDVKPANILFRADGAAVLSDFGIVRKLEDDGTQLTKQGYAVGTPAYMSPEQILGKKVDARSDLYSLGVLFHEMLTGKKPFQADETFALALKHISEPVPRLPEPYSRFQGILDTLMAKEPEQRFEDAAKMIHAIDDINKPGRSANLPETSPLQLPPDNDTTVIVDADSPATPRKSPDRNRSRFIWLTGVVAAATVAAGGVAAYLTLVPLTSSIQVCESPELSGSETDQITQLTEIADLNRDVGRLVDPPVSNAAYGYQEILKLDPCNKHAKAELDKIAQTYLDKAKESQQQNGDPRDTLNLIDAGLLASPKHEVLQKLKNEVSQKLRQN